MEALRPRRLPSIAFLSLILFASAFLSPSSSSVYAQNELSPSLRITRIDVQDFPDIRLYVQGRNLPSELADLPISLRENGEEVEDVVRGIADVGTQTALILDASGVVLDPGPTGEAIYVEVGNVVRRLVEQGQFSLESDWLASYAPRGENGEIAVVRDWTRDHQAVANELYIYQPPDNIDLVTPLYDLLFFALDRMEASDIPTNTAKSIVLFSDGITGSSSLELDDAVNRAVSRDITIHTVLLGAGTEEGQRNMRRIATLTGGNVYQLTALDALDGLVPSLIENRDQVVLAYRTSRAQPREVVVATLLEDGSTLRAASALPAIDARPVGIEILDPTRDLEITKEAPAFDTPLSDLEPKELPVQVDFIWPEGQARELRQVEYIINNDTQLLTEPPFDQITFPIAKLGDGNHTLRVVATDELGVRGESAPVTFSVTEKRPPAPEPTPPMVTVPVVNRTVEQTNVTTFASLFALVLGVIALIIALRKPTVRERVTEAVTGAVKAVTEPFMFNRSDALKGSEIKGKLIVEDRGRTTHLPAIIDVRGGTTRIGRVAEYANLVVDDPRVSRYHCRLTENPDGNLVLYDEGGSSGTYVNYEPVDMEGYVLRSGDLVNIGPVQFRFSYASDFTGDDSTQPYQPWDAKDVTEPFIDTLPEH